MSVNSQLNSVIRQRSRTRPAENSVRAQGDMAVACGHSHTLALADEGHVFVSGSGASGQLALGDREDRQGMVRVGGDFSVRVVMVSAGGGHSALQDSDGELWMSGWGAQGQLGTGGREDMLTPTRVPKWQFGGARVKMAACGHSHTLVLTEAGRVWAFGRGLFGQLGTGNQDDRTEPTEVVGLLGVTITFVAAGFNHSVAVSGEGGIFTWGLGYDGRLGHGGQEIELQPRNVEAGCFGADTVVQAAAGAGHTAAVTAEGRLYTWGDGFFGQLGQGTREMRLVPTLVPAEGLKGSALLMVACGVSHTLAVTRAGALYACGRGYYGQLCLSDKANGDVFELVRLPDTTDARIVTASAGCRHSAAVTEDGALFTWGSGKDYFDRPLGLGHGDLTERVRPTLVEPGSMSESRIGRFRALPREHALAFAMVTHPRLGHAQAKAQAAVAAGGGGDGVPGVARGRGGEGGGGATAAGRRADAAGPGLALTAFSSVFDNRSHMPSTVSHVRISKLKTSVQRIDSLWFKNETLQDASPMYHQKHSR